MNVRWNFWVLFLVLSSSIALGQAEGKGPRKMFYGKVKPFSAEELPAGKLKAELDALSPEAKAKAMQWLHRFSFSSLDAATHLRADSKGGIYYVCTDDHGNCEGHKRENPSLAKTPEADIMAADLADQVSQASIPGTGRASVSVTNPPAYHSKPGAPNVIYIDFNGAVVMGTSWNSSRGVTRWDCDAWTQDGDTTMFSDSEQAGMYQIWQRIAEDYAPFNVDVTTDVAFDPDNNGGGSDNVGWLLVCETVDINSKPCPHNGSGGIAYVDVFGGGSYSPNYQPAWVKPMGIANTAEAASHEMGHNMGLSHDGTSSLEYYGGHGSGDTSWGPIMGTGYGRNVSQWSKGEYYDSSRSQDDLSIISGKVSYMTDDHGGSHAAATEITPAGDGSFTTNGVIDSTGEKDVFWFATGAGSVTVSAAPLVCASGTKGGNLDVVLQMFDSTSALVASNNPAAGTTAGITTTVPAGNYFVHVSPTGAGTPMNANPSGYTVYGSLGEYTLSGTCILPGIGITESDGSTAVTEGDPTTDSYSMVLGTPPSSDVVVTIATNGQVSVNPASVTFNAGNWDQPQSVTVTAVDDSIEEGQHIGTITHSVSSSDPDFNGIEVADVLAVVTDDDYIAVTAPNGGERWVAGANATIEWFSLMAGNMKIELLKNGIPYSTIASNAVNSGSYVWSIPANQRSAINYKIRVTSVDTPATTDSSDADFSIISPIYYAGMDVSPVGWSGLGSGSGWRFGQPTGGQQDTYGYPDPTAGYNGPNVIGYNLSGDYAASMPSTLWARTPAFDCSDYENVKLSFQRWLGVERSKYDHAYIEVSINGSTWTQVWQNPDSHTDDSSWTYCEYDISAVADGQPVVYVRWGMGKTDSEWQWCGWNLDEVMVDGDSTLPPNGVLITEIDGSTDTAEGGATDTYTAELVSQPTAEVTLNITPDSQITVSNSVLTFTTNNWDQPQTVTVTAVDDSVHELHHTGTILHSSTSSDTNYHDLGINGILVNITDNDNNAPTVNAGPDQTIYMIGQSWSPLELSPLAWYDADDAGTLWANDLGTIPASTSVGRWSDKSGNDDHLLQAANAYKPITGSDQINGVNSVRFDGKHPVLSLGYWMQTASNPFGSMIRNASVFSVLNVKTLSDGVAFSLSGEPLLVSQRWQSQAPASDGKVYFDCGGDGPGGTRLSYDSGWSANENKLMGYFSSVDQSFQEIWESGTRMAKDTSGHAVLTGQGGVLLGSDGTTGVSKYDNVSFGEVVVLGRTLETEDRQLLEGFLAHKWGLSGDLPADHPYKTLNPDGAYGLANLDGTIADLDGDSLTLTWTLVSGPAGVTFANSNAVDTVVTFGLAGTYTFHLTADDTMTQSVDEVIITVVDGTDSDSDGLADAWEVSNLGGTGASDGTGDQDGDGFIDLHEFLAGTSPTNSNSLLSLDTASSLNGTEVELVWQSVGGKTYQLLSSTNLQQPGWQTNLTGIRGLSPTTTVTNSATGAKRYYLIKLE